MEAESAFQSYLNGALELFGLEADEEERAVMAGIWSIYQPGMELLRDADLEAIEAEMGADLSKPPAR
ncbi:MAG: hypothetical protein ACM31K_04605 [Solirubrobacterales bacterium]